MENVEFGRGVPMAKGCPWRLTQGMLLFSRAFGGQDKTTTPHNGYYSWMHIPQRFDNLRTSIRCMQGTKQVYLRQD